MSLPLLARFFPPPKYLWRPAAGLDISDRSVKFVELGLGRKSLIVKKIGEEELPAGFIENGNVKNQAGLADALKVLAIKHGLYWVTCNVPEEAAYVVRLKLPQAPLADLPAIIETELPEYIPLTADAVSFDFLIDSTDETGKWLTVDVFAVAAPLVEVYTETLYSAGLFPTNFEIESVALSRALVPATSESTAMIVDLGKIRASFSISRRQTVFYTTTVSGLGGDAFTASLKKNLKLTWPVAEDRKVRYGLSRRPDNQEQFFALVPMFAALADEIKKRLQFWHNQSGLTTSVGRVEEIILAGGQSTIPGLVEYLEGRVGLPVKIGEPWINVLTLADGLPPIAYNQALRYTTAIGLALKTFPAL